MDELLVQSRLQNVIDRIYKITWFCMIQVSIISTAYFVFDLSINPAQVYVALFIIILAAIIYPMWLAMLNTGENKAIELGVKLNESHLELIRLEEIRTIRRSDIQYFKITYGLLGKQVSVIGKSKNIIHFGYYAFSSAQRQQIIAYLQESV
ncbi:hypothetical protein JF50_18270 [Pseudoalteromonas luteoviolacea]|uniref:DUF304 domain-containing protein n=1 Tax=Pseudoalteromonas luteoviolacea TaxID=43657 RepID=A0A0C1Q6G2_9GAMM|nr:hypothetical protein [Pseudoalteromonas luteoviolacea]KID56216.1 hypothetical protein JF50_18270 [Pseudoalteromonas luteoviolacea]